MPSVTKWKVAPPCLTHGSLGLPVRTKTGARKGGGVRPADLTFVEHALAHHVGADAGGGLLEHLVVGVGMAVLKALALALALDVEHPPMDTHPTVAQGVVRSGDVPV